MAKERPSNQVHTDENGINVATCLPAKTCASIPAPLLPSTRASSRKNRVFVLREFILRTYGNCLSKGSIILDVAGGKGDLSWLLTNVDGIDSVVADPRLTNHSHQIKSVQFLREHPEEAAIRAIPGLPTHQPLASLLPMLSEKDEAFQIPKHLRLLVDADLVEAVRLSIQNSDDAMSTWNRFWETAIERAKKAKTLGYLEEGQSAGQILEASEALRTIRSAKLIVGFHPDQATDACIDLALLLRVPFCVCPCCVYPAEFPNRQLNGNRVRTHDQLLQYLCGKHPSIRTASLGFHETKTARNTVLYLLPEDLNATESER